MTMNKNIKTCNACQLIFVGVVSKLWARQHTECLTNEYINGGGNQNELYRKSKNKG